MTNSTNVSLGVATPFAFDPNIPQGSQAAAQTFREAGDNQATLVNAATGGRRRKKRRRNTTKKQKNYKGGESSPSKVVVQPLPDGISGTNTQANNVAMNQLFTDAVVSGEGDAGLVKTGGKRHKKRNTRKTKKSKRGKRRSSKRRKGGKRTKRTRRNRRSRK